MSTPIDAVTSGGDDAEPTPTIHNVHERRRLGAPAVLFVAGLAMVLFGGVLTVDAVGPTTLTDATITDVDTSGRRGRVTYTIGGTDIDGGTFRMDASRDAYERAEVGDGVTVERAPITARVVRIDGPGWENDSSAFVVVWLLVAVLGLAAMAWGVTKVQRQRRDNPEAPTLVDRTKWALPVVVLATAGWVVWERSNASGDAPAAVTTSNVPAEATAPATDPPAQGCPDLAPAAAEALADAVERGFVDAAATRSAFTALAIDHRGCDRATIEAAVCTALADAATADTGLVVFTEGLCPELP